MSRTLVTIATDGFRDYVSLPNGDTINLGTTSVLKLITEVVPFSADIRKALDTFLAKGTVTLAADQSTLLKVLRPKKSRWAAYENRFIPVGIQDPNGVWNSMSTDLFSSKLASLETLVELGISDDTTTRVARQLVASLYSITSKQAGRANPKDGNFAVVMSSPGIGNDTVQSFHKTRPEAEKARDRLEKVMGGHPYVVDVGPESRSEAVKSSGNSYFVRPNMKNLKSAGTEIGTFKVAAVDADAKRELDLFIENEGRLAAKKESILTNLLRKLKSDSYNHSQAPKLWMYLVDEGAKMYAKEMGSGIGDAKNLFPKELRESLAKDMADNELELMKNGEYDHLKKASSLNADGNQQPIVDLSVAAPALLGNLVASIEETLRTVESSSKPNGHLAKRDLHIISTKLAAMVANPNLLDTSHHASTLPMEMQQQGQEAYLLAGLEDLAGKVAKIQSHFACGGGCSGNGPAQSEAESLLSKVEDTLQVVEASGKSGANLAKKDLHTTTVRLASLLHEGVDSIEGQKALRNLSFNVSKIRSHFAGRVV